MRDTNLPSLSRRAVLLSVAAVPALDVATALAQDKLAGPSEFDAALQKILGTARPTEGKVLFEIPEIAENGNTVPYTISVESPMTETDFVKTLHVLSTGNPQPGIASFALTPASGRAFVSSRMRLARTQDVVAIAELSDGRFLSSKKLVKVTIGGCGG